MFVGLNDTSVIDDYLRRSLIDFHSYEYEIVTDVKSNFAIDEERKFSLRNGYMHVPVLLLVNKNHEKKSSITLKVKLFKKVLVANKDIQAGDEITLNDFNQEIREITNTRSKVVTDYSSLENKKAKRRLDKGDLLHERMLSEIPLISRGDIINAFLEYGSVVISFKASSRGVGSKGDKIRVERDDKRIFIAKVIDKNNVKIIE